MSIVIGLSFGNTSSSIAYLKEGKVEVIANQDGDRAIPSMLSYAQGDEYHGLQAKLQLVRNSKNTIGNFRDFLEKPFSSVETKFFGSKPLNAGGDTPGFEVTQGEDKVVLNVDEVVKRHFAKLYEAAREYIGRDIDGVVLAVPSDFSQGQRAKLVELAKAEKLPVLQVIHEASAALLAHVSRPDLPREEDRLFVVADFGGSRSDAAVISYNGGIFTTLATAHDVTLGGDQIDNALVNFLASEFQKQFGSDPLTDERAQAKLLQEAEQLKKTLSNSTTTTYGIESLFQGLDFSGSLNRLRFELTTRTLWSRFAEFVVNLIGKAGVSPLEVDDVLLVGGTSHIPKVASIISSVFEGSKAQIHSPSTDPKAIPPEELIARGAAIQGSLISGYDKEEIDESLEAPVVNGPHLSQAIGIEQADGSVVPIIASNTLLPIRKVVKLSASGSGLIRIIEVAKEIKTEVHKPEPKEKSEDKDDEDESDWSEDEDEEYETKKLVLLPGRTLLELGLKQVTDDIQLVVTVTAGRKLQAIAKSGAETVQGTSA